MVESLKKRWYLMHKMSLIKLPLDNEIQLNQMNGKYTHSDHSLAN